MTVRRIFLLSPAHCGGKRAAILLNESAAFPLAQRLHSAGISLGSGNDGFCKARLYPIELVVQSGTERNKIAAAILLPEVKNYPNNKIEIVAPVRLKEHLGVQDGDQLTWEFLN